MPVLTFLHELFSFGRGPYERIVGRHTRRFCSRAAEKAKNDVQKRVLMVAAVCADELLASILGVAKKSSANRSAGKVRPGADKKKVLGAMRFYLSALLVLLGTRKELMLQKTGIDEPKFLQLWCAVFEYQPIDMQRFDQELVPAYQRQDAEELATVVASVVSGQLFGGTDGIGASEVKERLVDDMAAIIRVLETLEEG
jgi:hypothetical protein